MKLSPNEAESTLKPCGGLARPKGTPISHKNNKDKIGDLFDQTVPYTTEDVVVMLIKVIGKKNGKLLEKSYQKNI